MSTHKDKDYYNKQKFIPINIHNKINIDLDRLKEYFLDNHTLKDCADYFNCSKITIKRKLKSVGIDTSIYNNSDIAKSKFIDKCSVPKPSDEDLKYMMVDRNLDSKTIAELYGVHFNTIRKQARNIGIKKSASMISKSMMSRHHRLHGCSHPSQRPDVISKTRKSSQKVSYKGHNFRSLHELSYALFLDSLGIKWTYEEMRIPYIDMLSGKHRIYVIDFTIFDNNDVWWIEVKPNENMIPEDKRIYASRRADESGVYYRGTTYLERQLGWSLLISGYQSNNIRFTITKPRKSAKKITYYFKDLKSANSFEIHGWHKNTIIKHGKSLYALKLDKL